MKTRLNYSVILFTTWLLTTNLTQHHGPKKELVSDVCLEIDGKIAFDSDNTNESCRIVLFNGSQAIDSLDLVDGRKKFKFALKENQDYSIVIKKTGYYSKLIWICTVLPTETIEEGGVYKFKFFTKLMSNDDSKNLSSDIHNYPVAIIKYNEKFGGFHLDRKYTEKMQKQLTRAQP